MEELDNSYIESNFTREYVVKLGGNAIEMEFDMLTLLMIEAKKPGFKNKFKDLRDYIEGRYDSMARFMTPNIE
jgi:hypothetical protein